MSDDQQRGSAPILIARQCGGWLAVSSPENGLKIGVTGASEEDARARFKESERQCWQILNRSPEMTYDNLYRFMLEEGETIHIGGIPYRHVGNGLVEGGTNPAHAREMRDVDESTPK